MYQNLYMSKNTIKTTSNGFPEAKKSSLMKLCVGIDYAAKQK